MMTLNELTEQESIAAATQSTISRLTDAVQNHMDKTAQQRGYDNLLSACTYATSSNLPFQAEGQACVEWRDAVWAYCYQVMGNVMSGNVAIPNESDLIASLPLISW